MPPGLEPFLAAVENAYRADDEDRLLIERSLELMSRELTERNDQLRTELAERQHIEEALLREKAEQAALFHKLEETHGQLLQSEKMASIGQLAAGLAHEINNPIGFVSSNLGTLRGYVTDLLKVIAAFEAEEAGLGEAARQRIEVVQEQADLGFVREDSMELLNECAEGIRRVRQIVRDLTDFSHMDDAQWHRADLHKGLESTLNIVHTELRYVADVIREYGELPEVECLPSQLNQVFLNILVNAAQAIKGNAGRSPCGPASRTPSTCSWRSPTRGEGIAPENLTSHLRPVLHHQAGGEGDGPGPGAVIRNHRQAPWPHRGGLQARHGHPVPGR